MLPDTCGNKAVYVQRYIVACSVTIVAVETAIYSFPFCAGIDVVVNNINVFTAAMKTTMDSFCAY